LFCNKCLYPVFYIGNTLYVSVYGYVWPFLHLSQQLLVPFVNPPPAHLSLSLSSLCITGAACQGKLTGKGHWPWYLYTVSILATFCAFCGPILCLYSLGNSWHNLLTSEQPYADPLLCQHPALSVDLCLGTSVATAGAICWPLWTNNTSAGNPGAICWSVYWYNFGNSWGHLIDLYDNLCSDQLTSTVSLYWWMYLWQLLAPSVDWKNSSSVSREVPELVELKSMLLKR